MECVECTYAYLNNEIYVLYLLFVFLGLISLSYFFIFVYVKNKAQ